MYIHNSRLLEKVMISINASSLHMLSNHDSVPIIVRFYHACSMQIQCKMIVASFSRNPSKRERWCLGIVKGKFSWKIDSMTNEQRYLQRKEINSAARSRTSRSLWKDKGIILAIFTKLEGIHSWPINKCAFEVELDEELFI